MTQISVALDGLATSTGTPVDNTNNAQFTSITWKGTLYRVKTRDGDNWGAESEDGRQLVGTGVPGQPGARVSELLFTLPQNAEAPAPKGGQ